MFKPGQLHIHYTPLLPGEIGFEISVCYEVRQNAEHETVVHFDMSGEINGKAFADSFELPRDTAFNFASNATRIAVRNGLPTAAVHPLHAHRQYDLMFEDIRQQLHARPGEPVKPEHLC
ncbi:DUF5064 family protein [Phytopseudomonas dryadis]|uniref:DUF5064 domain-containing protein n=1 Tax=Phytopseudomonas dryadis TaxID=2487520 RepID=A0A4Q9R498_9GAMM|nr:MULTISPECIES: DUF5064 family protein [Pseudomonas]TBU93965.1 DUF5064 domain-containing protein [Pseudomonas dryadis]TBV07873.1 DUF5064 domain-containing protein [Pseudomonas dryadis]TBV19268.1 DUF5064 domain-containing protein [Pseudomonas sp. FRB 230]